MNGSVPVIMPYQFSPFNGDRHIEDEFIHLRNEFDIITAVETGTAMGGTTKFLAENFNRVFTIEINQAYRNYAIEYIGDRKNVTSILGDSAMKIGEVLNECDDNTILFLDAHWHNHCPLQDELKAIANRGIRPVIAIHDFCNPNDNRFGYDTYRGQDFTFGWLKPYFDLIYGVGGYGYYYNTGYCEESAKRGIIYITP